MCISIVERGPGKSSSVLSKSEEVVSDYRDVEGELYENTRKLWAETHVKIS